MFNQTQSWSNITVRFFVEIFIRFITKTNELLRIEDKHITKQIILMLITYHHSLIEVNSYLIIFHSLNLQLWSEIRFHYTMLETKKKSRTATTNIITLFDSNRKKVCIFLSYFLFRGDIRVYELIKIWTYISLSYNV